MSFVRTYFRHVFRACASSALKDITNYFDKEQGQVAVSQECNG